MGVSNDGELTEMLACLARASGEGDVVAVKRRGPKTKHENPKELHLKFSGELRAHIERVTGGANYQSYFDELVKRDMEQHKEIQGDRK